MGSIVPHIYDLIQEYGSLENYQAALKEAIENKPEPPDLQAYQPRCAAMAIGNKLLSTEEIQ